MSQYLVGKVSVTNGQTTVVGAGTAWSTELAAGQLFAIRGTGIFYAIASITDDTHLVLQTPYSGDTAATQAYLVQRDFTVNNAYPTPTYGDVDTAALIAQTLLKIDAQLAALSPVAGVIQGEVDLLGSFMISGGSLPSAGDASIQVGDLFVDAGNFVKRAIQIGGQ